MKTKEQLLKEYIEADKTYHDKLSEYYSLSEITSGQRIEKPDKVLTVEAFEELEKLAKEAEEKRKLWVEASHP